MYRFLEAESRILSEECGLVGHSKAMVMLHRAIAAAAKQDTAVLLRGETGSGKELVAVHRMSPRGNRPMVCVNMGALAPSLAEAELFGAEKGAFTGAVRRQTGLFRRAHESTLFLDEVGDTPGSIQAMLLRALETKTVRALGSERDEISATYERYGGDIDRMFRHLKVSRPALIRRLRHMQLPV